MTPDVAAIRAALAAATPDTTNHSGAHWMAVSAAKGTIRANAPTWLAALCDEVVRLEGLKAKFSGLVAERDAAYAKGYQQAMTDEGYSDRRTGSMSENDDG